MPPIFPTNEPPHSDEESAALEAWAVFRTRQPGDPVERVRTCGAVGLLPAVPGLGPSRFGLVSADGERIAPFPEPSGLPLVETGRGARHARGKTAYVTPYTIGFGVACYQSADDGTAVELAACGNSSAAAAALRQATCGGPLGPAWLELPGGSRLRVDTEILPVPADEPGTLLRQTWREIHLEVVEERLVTGRRCLACLAPLNDYVVVGAQPGEPPAAFPQADALTIWRAFGFDANPLRARLAVVETAVTSPVRGVKFFTCGSREHPSAPLTGLAVLALAGEVSDWLGWTSARLAMTPAGPMALPLPANVSAAGRRVRADAIMPPVRVELEWRRRIFPGLARSA